MADLTLDERVAATHNNVVVVDSLYMGSCCSHSEIVFHTPTS